MSTDIELPFPYWDINKSKYEEIDNLPLMATPGPVLIILAVYLLFVLKIGPSLMLKREPYKLTTALILYNAIQVVLSAYIVKVFFKQLVNLGLTPKTCYVTDDKYRNEILFSIWLYFAAKISELMDTVFFVMRKKDNQITFLHLYHHSIMMIGTWAYLKYCPSEMVSFIGFLNSLVHTFMYTYYGLAALGPKVEKFIFWKKYMTKFQLVQFVCVFIHYIIASQRSECPPTLGKDAHIAANAIFFFILFLRFYWKSYKKGRKMPSIRVCQNIEKEE